MSVCIWVTLWVSDSQGCLSAVKTLKTGRVTTFAYFPKAAEREAGHVHGQCTTGGCVFVHSGVCLKGALCVQETVAYEHMHVCVCVSVHMCSYICGGVYCAGRRGKCAQAVSMQRKEHGKQQSLPG